jgi:putative peptidoglycan lipid II flippase
VATDHEGFSKALDWGLRITLLIAVPAMFGLMLLAQPLVATLFQNGQFRPFDTRMATLSVTALSFGVPAYAQVKVLLPAFYARKDTRTPVRAGVAALLSNMLLNGVFLLTLYAMWAPSALKAGPLFEGLSKVPGLHLALGMASAVASYINLLLLWRWLRQADIYQRQPGWGRHLARLALACAAMTMVLLLGRWYWPDWTQMQVFGRVWRLALLVCAGGGTYVAVLFATGFRLRELHHA